MTKILITGLVTIHLAATLWHGSAHTQIAITLPPEKNAFVYVVILIAPIVALGLVWTRYLSIGLWVFFLLMLGAFLFGAYHHYVLISPDNIGHLPGGSPESRGKDQEEQWREFVLSKGARLDFSRESFKACSGSSSAAL